MFIRKNIDNYGDFLGFIYYIFVVFERILMSFYSFIVCIPFYIDSKLTLIGEAIDNYYDFL